MFKIGDKVRIIKNPTNFYAVTIPGCEGIVVRVDQNLVNRVLFQVTKHPTHDWHQGAEYQIHTENLELIKNKDLFTEVDYLDAFQANFKNGF